MGSGADPDVLIVGAGPSGAIAAKRLAEDGFKVLVLEQGDWPDYSRATVTRDDFPLTAGRDWGWDPNLRDAPGDYPIDDSDSDITALMWNGVGGGTVVYAAQWQRNMPSDFRVRTLDGVADDWPLTYEDLEPYYVRVERDFGISGLAGDTAFPPGEGPPLPPVPLGPAGRRVARAHNELGWHWWPAPLAIATRKYGRLNPWPRARRTSRTGRAVSSSASSFARARGCASWSCGPTGWSAARSISTRTASSTRSAPA
jgi:choline dehydrogenase-like flavoprotein